MRIVLAILVLAMTFKDFTLIGDRYVMRGLAQGLCLVAGMSWLSLRLSPEILARYWPMLLYLFYISCIAITANGLDTFVQAGSLAAIVLFSIAYVESRVDPTGKVLVGSTGFAYGMAAIGSLLLVKLSPTLAYEQDHGWVSGHRFQGLFAEPGMMAAVAGVLVGVSVFGIRRWWLKVMTLVPGVLCLALTGSRTFWVACLIAAIVTGWWCYPRLRKWLLLGAAVGGLAAATLATFHYNFNNNATKRILREDSIVTLTGRLGVWAAAYEAWQSRPLLGYGYTHGSDGLIQLGPKLRDYLTEYEAMSLQVHDVNFSLHSGYIQALLDTGLIGATLYLFVIANALRRLYGSGQSRQQPVAHYLLLYLIIANFSETVIYTASVYYSIIFWYLAAYAYSLRAEAGILTESAGQLWAVK